jgi:hypothetical protein
MRTAVATATAAVIALIACPAALAAPTTTVERTIQDCDGDNLLEFARGEQHLDLSSPFPEPSDDGCEEDQAGRTLRLPNNASILNFLQLSDFQMVDEESPGRVEFLDTTQRAPGLNPFSAAYRPQESLTTQVTEAMVRQARNTTSPVTGEQLDLTILTGDNADSQQYNETRWFIDILDGTTGDEDPDPDMNPQEGGDKIDPDSGIEKRAAPCDPTYKDNDSPYDGVRAGGRVGQDTGYYEPDRSSGPDEDGDGYSPDRDRNRSEVPGEHADVTVRDFPGLLEKAQEPFEAVGLGMPWYSAFGNHDALVQGNSASAYAGPFGPTGESVNPTFDAIVRGCLKPTQLPAGTTANQFINDPSTLGTAPMVVPPDPRRCHLPKDKPSVAAEPCKRGWIPEHSRTAGAPVGHGFEPFTLGPQAGAGRPATARANHDGYYSFKPRRGFRFVVLDTVTDECLPEPVCSEGSVDHAQYEWLEGQLSAAKTAGENVLTFSHHTLRTTRFETDDPTERPVHHGERFDRKSTPPRPVRPDAPPESTLEDLFCRHEKFIGHVAGHEHENYVLKHRCEDPPAQQSGKFPFWEISTAAHIDWPQQSRMLEFVRLGGKMALVLTLIDHDGPANPGGPPPERIEQGRAGEQPVRLASIARELSYNDYQSSRGARGERTDRNVIIPLEEAPPE